MSIIGANSEDFVLTIALQTLSSLAGEGPNLIFAAIVLSVIIPFTVVILAQRYFVENVATSGINNTRPTCGLCDRSGSKSSS